MATISSAGIGSGLQVADIISQLMTIERAPKDKLAAAATATQTKISEVGKIASAMSKFRELGTKLASSSFWQQTTASSSTSAIGVTSTSTASPANYAVNVTQLAASQSVAAGKTFASPDALVGSGTLTLSMGTWDATQTGFTANATATPVDVTIEATDTLASLRDKINASGSGVTAAILTDSSGARLVMRSKESGAANGFSVAVAGATGDLGTLSYAQGAKTASLASPAANAQGTIDGLPVSSSTNTFNNVLDGVSLTFNALTPTPASVNVVSDTETIKKALNDFATAYNDVVKVITADTKYDAATKKAGPLQGDSSIVGVLNEMRAILGSNSTASSAFGRLSDVGFEQQRDGTLSVNDKKLSNALTNLKEMKALFANTNLTDPANDGMARRFRSLADKMLNTEGTLTAKTTALNDQLKRNQKSQDALEQRLIQTQKRLERQYGALDTKISSSNALNNYVSQQITLWNKSS